MVVMMGIHTTRAHSIRIYVRTLCEDAGEAEEAAAVDVGVARAPDTACAAALPTVVEGGRRFLLWVCAGMGKVGCG